jgi:hypothetical protein
MSESVEERSKEEEGMGTLQLLHPKLFTSVLTLDVVERAHKKIRKEKSVY